MTPKVTVGYRPRLHSSRLGSPPRRARSNDGSTTKTGSWSLLQVSAKRFTTACGSETAGQTDISDSYAVAWSRPMLGFEQAAAFIYNRQITCNLDKTRITSQVSLLLKMCHLSAILPEHSSAFQTQSVRVGNLDKTRTRRLGSLLLKTCCVPDPKRKGWQLCIYNLDKTRTRSLVSLQVKTCHLSATLPDHSSVFQTQSVRVGNSASTTWTRLEVEPEDWVIIAQNMSSVCYTS